MRDTFLKLCGDDPICKLDLAGWKKEITHWTNPSDHGTCITIVSGAVQRVNSLTPFKDVDNTEISWVDLFSTSIAVPGKISWAPIKTWIQANCHEGQKCGDIGNWQSTVNTLDTETKKSDSHP